MSPDCRMFGLQLLLVLFVVYVSCFLQSVLTGEYCLLEAFDPTCPQGSVILMMSAFYGRMRLGRCLTRDYYVGCNADVTAQLDYLCSGRSHCHVSIPEPNLINFLNCPKDLVAYLEAEYKCIKVQTGSSQQCLESSGLYLNGSVGYLTSDYTRLTDIGGVHCPWRIVVRSGQRINLTLYNLRTNLSPVGNTSVSASRFLHTAGSRYSCSEAFATIREPSSPVGDESEKTICVTASRQTLIYVSQGNSLTITLLTEENGAGGQGGGNGKYILKYEAAGCPDPVIPESAYMSRNGGQVYVVCKQPDSRSWNLECHGNEWVNIRGEEGEEGCSNISNVLSEQDVAMETNSANEDGSYNFYQDYQLAVWVALIVGVAVGVAMGFCLLIFLNSLRKQLKSREKEYLSDDYVHCDSTCRNDVIFKRACSTYSFRLWTETDSTDDLYSMRCLRDTTAAKVITQGHSSFIARPTKNIEPIIKAIGCQQEPIEPFEVADDVISKQSTVMYLERGTSVTSGVDILTGVVDVKTEGDKIIVNNE